MTRQLTGRRRIRSVEERFWPKVDCSAPLTCWVWRGALTKHGYGNFIRWDADGVLRNVQAHRIAYELLVGPVPHGLVLDHLCRNRACVNPAHLEPVTEQVNIARGQSPAAVSGRRGSCPHGHPHSDENTRWVRGRSGRVYRQCRVCTRSRLRALRVRRAAEFQRAEAGERA